MIATNVERVTFGDELTENHLNLQFPSVCFGFTTCNFNISLYSLIESFLTATGNSFHHSKTPVDASIKQQTGKVGFQLVKKVKYLTARELDLSLLGVGGLQSRDQIRVNIGLISITWPETSFLHGDFVISHKSCQFFLFSLFLPPPSGYKIC